MIPIQTPMFSIVLLFFRNNPRTHLGTNSDIFVIVFLLFTAAAIFASSPTQSCQRCLCDVACRVSQNWQNSHHTITFLFLSHALSRVPDFACVLPSRAASRLAAPLRGNYKEQCQGFVQLSRGSDPTLQHFFCICLSSSSCGIMWDLHLPAPYRGEAAELGIPTGNIGKWVTRQVKLYRSCFCWALEEAHSLGLSTKLQPCS